MNTLKKFCGGASLAALIAFTIPQGVAQTSLYGLTFFDNQLLSINATTGEGSLIANLSLSVNGYGLAFRGTNLYTFDPNVDAIRQINLSTGAVGAPISIGVGNLTGEGDLAFRSDGIGFLSSALSPSFSPSNDLFRFDLATGTSVRLGTTSVVIDAMAFMGNTLYAIGQEGSPSLYTVNQTNGALAMVGSLGLNLGSPFSALTLGTNGLLYAALDDRLYRINQTTGLATAVSATIPDMGYGSVSGLAAPAAVIVTAVPEPSTYGLFAVMGLVLMAWLRRTKRQFVRSYAT